MEMLQEILLNRHSRSHDKKGGFGFDFGAVVKGLSLKRRRRRVTNLEVKGEKSERRLLPDDLIFFPEIFTSKQQLRRKEFDELRPSNSPTFLLMIITYVFGARFFELFEFFRVAAGFPHHFP